MPDDVLRVAANAGTQLESFVVRFFVARDGSLHCRITNVQRGLSWIVRDARDLHALIETQPPGRARLE